MGPRGCRWFQAPHRVSFSVFHTPFFAQSIWRAKGKQKKQKKYHRFTWKNRAWDSSPFLAHKMGRRQVLPIVIFMIRSINARNPPLQSARSYKRRPPLLLLAPPEMANPNIVDLVIELNSKGQCLKVGSHGGAPRNTLWEPKKKWIAVHLFFGFLFDFWVPFLIPKIGEFSTHLDIFWACGPLATLFPGNFTHSDSC